MTGIHHVKVSGLPNPPSGAIGGADWDALLKGNGLGWFSLADYNPLGGGADDYTALQACAAAAFAKGGTMYLPMQASGDLWATSGPIIPGTVSGEIRIVGDGRSKSFNGGVNGDPTTPRGSGIKTLATAESVLKFAPATNQRQLVSIENLTVQGNPAGTTGHAIHFDGSVGSILPDVDKVLVLDAKQHGVFLDGGVFEGSFDRVRFSNNGVNGLKAAVNGTLPGEIRLYRCVFNLNDVNIDLAGGGNFALFGVTSSYANEAIRANGVGLVADDLQMEGIGQSSPAGNKATFTNLYAPVFHRLVCGCDSGDTGIGLAFVTCHGAIVNGYYASSAIAGAGYRDFSFSSSDSCEMNGYYNTDAVDRFDLGASGSSSGANVVRRGSQWLSSQRVRQIEYSSAVDGTDDLDLIGYDSFVSKRTASGKTRNIRFPTRWNDNYRTGQRVTIHIYNASAGATTTTWDSFWHLAGAWVDPAAGKTRTITFEYNGYGFYEIARSAADIT